MGRPEKTLEKLESIDAEHRENKSLELLIWAYFNTGDIEKTMQYSEEGIRKFSNGSIAPGDKVKAEHLEGLDKRDVESLVYAHSKMGYEYLLRKEFDKALLYFENILVMGEALDASSSYKSHVSAAFYNIACICALQKEPERMYRNIVKVIEVNPERALLLREDEDCKQYWADAKFIEHMAGAKKRVG